MIKYLIFLLILNNFSFSEINLPLDHTALILEKGKKELGIFHPFVFGKDETTQYTMHPILEFVIPNIEIKKTFFHDKKTHFAWALKLAYPTPLLKIVQKEGIGGFIANDPDFKEIPHIFTLKTLLFNTRQIFSDHLFTISTGIGTAVKNGTFSSRATIDMPWIYPRMNQYNNPLSFNAGIHFTGMIWKSFGYDSGANLTYTVGGDQNLSFEFGDYFFWQASEKVKIYAGYDLYYAEYPFGIQWHLLPMIDLRYNW